MSGGATIDGHAMAGLREAQDWPAANQRYLMAALGTVRRALERHAAPSQETPAFVPADAEERGGEVGQALRQMAAAMPAPPALETVCQLFDLSAFERRVLLLCAGTALDGSFASLCAAAHGDARRPYPTFGLALNALPEAHWDAMSPAGPLRTWRLIELESGGSATHPVTESQLRIDERILNYLTGVEHLDERLVGFVEPLPTPSDLVPSHLALAERLAATWSQAVDKGPLPVVQLCGHQESSQRAIAAAAAAMLGLALHVMPAQGIPTDPRELQALMRLWEREAALSGSALLVECGELAAADANREAALVRLLENCRTALIVASPDRRSIRHRPSIALEVERPTAAEQMMLWESGLGDAVTGLDGRLETLVAQFSLSAPALQAVCAEALGRVTADGSPHDLGALLWDAARVQARPRLDDLTQRIKPVATWDDLVLPQKQKRMLREIAMHVRQRITVYEAWGFAAKSSRGLGISALFAGASGTGKTMAAEVLANELRLDLYLIDLSQVVSKYIGETEKNLRRVFDAAEAGGAILLFDEADALFGKRSEVKDSHDRYANIEISYLLQRMEAYRGLAILTTNMKSALDTAFLRRIRFVVQFPFPNAAQRAEIWRGIFPAETPTEGLDVETLARLNVAGGSIRNIALHAAFLAAEAGEPIQMRHLLRAARTEYRKLEKSLTETEIRGWV
jgi:AAA+ superfamily predicted ATPase